jgi:hypothetical protein
MDERERKPQKRKGGDNSSPLEGSESKSHQRLYVLEDDYGGVTRMLQCHHVCICVYDLLRQ